MSTWYLAINGKSEGPYTEDQIASFFQSGRINNATPLWKEGMTEWAPLSSLKELKEVVAGKAKGGAGIVPPQMPPARTAHEIDYKIFGHEMQFVEIELDPGESAVAEAGAMMYMTENIKMDTVFGDGSHKSQAGGIMEKLLGAGKRLITGESLFCTLFTQTGGGKGHVAFAAPYPGKIIPLDLKKYDGEIVCQKDAFLCAAKGVSIGIAFQKRIGTALFGGEGFIMQKLEGDGWAFVHAGGTIVEKQLAAGQHLKVDTGCLVALTKTVNYEIKFVGNVKSAIFGGEGFFFATLTGPGHVWLQSLPFSRLAGRIFSSAPQRGGSKGEGSVLGGLGNLFQD